MVGNICDCENGTPSWCDPPDPPEPTAYLGDICSDVILCVDGCLCAYPSGSPTGQCTGNNCPSGPGCLLGDLTGDEGWNVLDVVTLVNCVLGGGDNCECGDMNQDGGTNVLDVVTLVQCILAGNCGGSLMGRPELDNDKWRYSPPPGMTSEQQEQILLDIINGPVTFHSQGVQSIKHILDEKVPKPGPFIISNNICSCCSDVIPGGGEYLHLSLSNSGLPIRLPPQLPASIHWTKVTTSSTFVPPS
jgi:hypothetical protein